MARVVCAGHVNWDLTLRVDQLPEPDGEVIVTDQSGAGGGSAANVATALAGLGHEPTLLGSVGDDEHGRRAIADLTAAGVDCSQLQTVDGETARKRLIVDEDGQVMVLSADGANEAFDPTDLSLDRLAAADHLHLTGQDPDTAEALAARGAAVDLSVSVDPGRRIDRPGVERVLARADLIFLNEREATTARQSGVLESAAGATVITQGADGAKLRRGDTVRSHPGFHSDPTDTAGAGDAFAAGYLSARLEGRDRDEALAVANACGALAVESPGARTEITPAAVTARRSTEEHS